VITANELDGLRIDMRIFSQLRMIVMQS
jgi:hypothetical protein